MSHVILYLHVSFAQDFKSLLVQDIFHFGRIFRCPDLGVSLFVIHAAQLFLTSLKQFSKTFYDELNIDAMRVKE